MSIAPAFQGHKEFATQQQLQGTAPFGNNASQHLARQQRQQLDRRLSEQTVENLLRYRDQFHAQRLDLEHKIRSLAASTGPDGAPVVANMNKDTEDAVRQHQSDSLRCMAMEQTIQKHINAKQG